MLEKQIVNLLKKISLEKLKITKNLEHINIIAVGKIFLQLTPVERQQIIYNPLIELITLNKIHSISINTYTPEEWKKINLNTLQSKK